MEQNKEKELPIGFMDSGLGGISVLKAAVHLFRRFQKRAIWRERPGKDQRADLSCGGKADETGNQGTGGRLQHGDKCGCKGSAADVP